MDKIFTIHVNLKNLTINEAILSNLASEFYGKELAAIGEPDNDKISLAFETFTHPILQTEIEAKNCAKEFLSALSCFKKNN